jgi:hypothetical protein
MTKRIAFKLALMVTAVSAMTLLQGCDGEEDGATVTTAWTPVGVPGALTGFFIPGQTGTTTSGGGTAGAPASGGQTVGGAVNSAMGGGAGSVSTGGAM